MLAASVAGWLVEGPVHAMIGPGTALAVSFLVSTVAFFVAKRIVTDLRG